VAASQVAREDPAAPRTELLADVKEASLRIGTQTLKFTNLKKVYYPDDGYTKRDVLNYYDGVADLILPHLKDRPLSLKRYPNGIKQDYFFQKDAADSFAPWLRTERIDDIHYVFAEDRASLLYLVNLGCIDHNPWMSRSPSLDHPDFILIDLDPQECLFDKIVDAALLVKRVLDRIGLVGYPKTTGGDGMHVYVPVEPIYTYEETRTFADLISRLAIAEDPNLFTTPRAVAKRQKNRLSAERPVEDHRCALCVARLLRGAGGDAAGVVRGAPRLAPCAIQYYECARSVRRAWRLVRRGFESATGVRGGIGES